MPLVPTTGHRWSDDEARAGVFRRGGGGVTLEGLEGGGGGGLGGSPLLGGEGGLVSVLHVGPSAGDDFVCREGVKIGGNCNIFVIGGDGVIANDQTGRIDGGVVGGSKDPPLSPSPASVLPPFLIVIVAVLGIATAASDVFSSRREGRRGRGSTTRHRSFASSASPSSTTIDDSRSKTEHSETPCTPRFFATTLPSVGAPSCNVKVDERDLYSQIKCNNSAFLSSSAKSISGNKKGRPLPDMAAFDGKCSKNSSSSAFEPPVLRDKYDELRPVRSLSMKNMDRVRQPLRNRIQNECQVEKGLGGVGSTISLEADFETLGLLGSGAFADVYKARCRTDNRLYAIKRNRRHFRSRHDCDRAQKEVRIMQRLQTCVRQNHEKFDVCPYLVHFVRAWQEDGHLFCQTELCCHDNLRHMMLALTKEWSTAKKKFPSFLRNLPRCTDSGEDINGRLLPESSVWKICHDVAAGLSHIHSRGYVHHDIKPSNIFFVPHEFLGCICKIGDFGLAGNIGSAEDGQEGDTTFMPMELLSSAVKQPGADIFSLGLTLYELASDCQWELPTEGPRWHEIRSGTHPPLLASKRSPELLELVEQMICPKVKARPSAAKILGEIGAVRKAGSDRDKFLADYVRDMHEFESMREHQIAAVHKAAKERCFTPTAAVLANPEAFL